MVYRPHHRRTFFVGASVSRTADPNAQMSYLSKKGWPVSDKNPNAKEIARLEKLYTPKRFSTPSLVERERAKKKQPPKKGK